MKWSDIAGLAGKAAPLLGMALGGPAGASIGSMVSNALGVENSPSAVAKALETDPEAAVKIKALEVENSTTLAQIAADRFTAELEADTARIQSEHQSGDEYVMRTRPKMARRSLNVALIYAVATTIVIPLLNWLTITFTDSEATMTDVVFAFSPIAFAAIASPALEYTGVRSFDKWKGKL